MPGQRGGGALPLVRSAPRDHPIAVVGNALNVLLLSFDGLPQLQVTVD